MAEPLGKLLPEERFAEPPEVRIIKEFVRENYKQPAIVLVQPQQIVIQVKGAALAGTLRTRLHELTELCQTEKRLVIRIG